MATRTAPKALRACSTHWSSGVIRRRADARSGLPRITSIVAPALPRVALQHRRTVTPRPGKRLGLKPLAAGGAAAESSAPDSKQPPEWLQKVPFVRKAPNVVLHRINIAVNVLIIAAVVVTAFCNFFTANESLWNKWVASTQRLLQNAPAAAWKSYTHAAATQPWTTCMVISGVTYFLADWTAQTFEGRPLLGINTMRLLRSVLVGALLLGPFAHGYYHFQDQLFSSIIPESWTTLMVAPFKIAVDQTVYAAAYNVVFYMGLGLFGLRNPLETWAETRRVFWRLMRAGWKVWPLVHCFTYTVIPITHRLLWVDTVEVAWVTFLSIVANEKKKATEEVILNETQAETAQAIEEQLDTRSEEMIVEAQVKELIEKDSIQDLVTAMENETSKAKVTEAVVAYSEDRKSRSNNSGGDPALVLLDAIQAESIVQGAVARVLRQAGIEAKSIDEMSPSTGEDDSSKGTAPSDIQALAAEDLKAISQRLKETFQEIARETAVAEVAKLTQDMDEVLVVAVEKDETIEKLKDELSAARQQLLQKEAEEEAEAEEKSERPWLGP